MKTEKLDEVQLVKGIYASCKKMDHEITEEQDKVLIEVLTRRKPHLYIPHVKKFFPLDVAIMIGTALQQNYSKIPTLSPDFENIGFEQVVLDGISETIKRDGKITKEELQAKAS